jgi:hypothetical protein
MNNSIPIDSTALFFEPQREPVVPHDLVVKIVEWSASLCARPLLFTASGAEFKLDDCYVYSDDVTDIMLWETQVPNRKRELIDALKQHAVSSVSFDVPLPTSTCRSQWSYNFSVYPESGEVYCGVASDIGKTALSLKAFDITRRFFDVRYGFAYSMPLLEEPDCYATGSRRTNLTELRQWLESKPTQDHSPLTDDECWEHELMGRKRHLTRLFRDAYAVNVISAAHVRQAGLASAKIGVLTNLDEDHWLWQINEESLREASDYLAGKQLLVRQCYS